MKYIVEEEKTSEAKPANADASTKPEAVQVGAEEVINESEIKDNPYILSERMPVPPHSFVDGRQEYDPNCPPAKYFDESILLEALPTHKADILRGMQEQEYGGLVCTD